MERNQNQQEKAALAKLERIKLDQGKRAEDLERDAAEAESKVSFVAVCFLQSTQPWMLMAWIPCHRHLESNSSVSAWLLQTA